MPNISLTGVSATSSVGSFFYTTPVVTAANDVTTLLNVAVNTTVQLLSGGNYSFVYDSAGFGTGMVVNIQGADGVTWPNYLTDTANGIQTFQSPACELQLDVSGMTKPLDISIARIPLTSRDRHPIFLKAITTVTTFHLQGGNYALSYVCSNWNSATLAVKITCPNGTSLVNVATATANAVASAYLPPGLYSVDPTGLGAALTMSITPIPA